MSRYIDADEAKKHFGDYFEKLGVARRYAESIIDNAIPTADVEPVRHGRWEIIYKHSEIATLVKCSECGHERYIQTGEEVNYCPNCGAKMDEKEQENEQDARDNSNSDI